MMEKTNSLSVCKCSGTTVVENLLKSDVCTYLNKYGFQSNKKIRSHSVQKGTGKTSGQDGGTGKYCTHHRPWPHQNYN